MVRLVDKPVDLMTQSLTLDRLMLEDYPDTLFESQRKAVKKEREWYFHFSGLKKDILYPFLKSIESKLSHEAYIIRENGQITVKRINY